MGVQNFLKGGLLRESVRYKIYIGAIEGGRGGKREISRRTVSIATEKRFDRFSIGIGGDTESCRYQPPLFQRSQWRVTIADNAMITIGNSTDASHAKKLRRIVRDRISIPSNASTNISDSGIRASPLSLVRLHSISIRTAPFPRRGGGEGREFTKLEKEERAMLFLLLDPSLSPHLLDPRYSRRFL